MTDSPVTKTAETVLAVAQVLREAGDSAYLPDVERALREAGLLASGAPSEEQIERAARALWAGHGLNGEWEAGTYEAHELCREDARAALAAAGVGSPVPVQVDEALQDRIADTLAYYQCRETKPKADHPRMGYHAFSEDQRTHLKAQKAEAAAEIMRMITEALRVFSVSMSSFGRYSMSDPDVFNTAQEESDS